MVEDNNRHIIITANVGKDISINEIEFSNGKKG